MADKISVALHCRTIFLLPFSPIMTEKVSYTVRNIGKQVALLE